LRPCPQPPCALALLCVGLLCAPAFAQVPEPVDTLDGMTADAPVEPEALPERSEPQAGDRVLDVRVEGNRRVEAEAIRRALRTQVGRPFDRARTADDLRALWALGYFSDVQLLVQRVPAGVVYVVRVEERPAIREVKLEGNEELGKDDFKEAIDLKPFSILDADAVRRTQKKIQDKYVDKGYFLAEVTHRLDKVPGANEVDVVFVIRENSKVMVKEIRLLGVEKAPMEEIKGAMATKEGGFLSFLTNEGTYREELFQRDLAMIQAAYYDRGFINVKVDKPQVSISADKKYIYITLRVEEGEPYRIGKLDFQGDLLLPKEELGKLMSSAEGELFNRSKLSKDILALTDAYYDRGYAYANISPLTAVNAEEKTIDLTFGLDKGRQVTVERIEVVGNTKTRDKVIRRELRVYEGELFSGTGMRRSKQRVTALGYFETVEVTHRPGSDDSHVVVQVEVKEKATGTFQLGLGFSNVENFVFTAQVQQQNFLGWGQSVSASVQWSSLRQLLQFSYFDPYFLDTHYILSVDVYRQQADYLGFLRNATGGTANIGYRFDQVSPLLEDVAVNLAYTREYVQVEAGRNFQDADLPLANRFRSGTTSSVRASISWDKRDNRLFPTSGHFQFASVEVAPGFLGSEFQFARYTAFSRFYRPLPLGFIFKTNATFGYIQPLQQNNPLPISELYYLGGINTVRGYFLRSLSPTILVGSSTRPDAGVTKFPVGGNKQVILNAELELPIFEKVGIRGVVFYDAGNAFGENEPLFQDKQDRLPFGLFQSVGFGFRWFSPIGPLRFEWGIPLNKRPEDQSILFEFTIGNFF
jgi:outer membrane protein insertion porin family